jgi:thymidylate synthase (FAD)
MRLILEPSVRLVAFTVTDEEAIDEWLAEEDIEWLAGRTGNSTEKVVEAGGRLCYSAFKSGRPTPKWFENVISEGHTSVLRHASFTFAVKGVSRSLLQQLARHHHLDPSVLSQRFVDQSDEAIDLGLVVPPAMGGMHRSWKKIVEPAPDSTAGLFGEWKAACERQFALYERLRGHLVGLHYTRKEAGEAARSVLPEAMETRFFVSGNGEAWLAYCGKRLPEGVDAEHRRLARVIATQLKETAPHIFASLEV